MKISNVLLFMVLALAACNQPQQLAFKSNGRVDYCITHDEEIMLDSIQHKTFLYFLNEHHPEIGRASCRERVFFDV
jgi:hypothetical protein